MTLYLAELIGFCFCRFFREAFGIVAEEYLVCLCSQRPTLNIQLIIHTQSNFPFFLLWVKRNVEMGLREGNFILKLGPLFYRYVRTHEECVDNTLVGCIHM